MMAHAQQNHCDYWSKAFEKPQTIQPITLTQQGHITEERDQIDIEDRRPRAAVTTKYQEDPCGSHEPRQTQQKSNLQRLQTM